MFRVVRLLLFVALMAPWISTAPAAETQRPNILLLMSDDQSWLFASAYGCEAIETPAFDRLAREGVLFEHAYCMAPQCAPARATMLSGRPMWQLEEGAVQRSTFPAKFTCYTDVLRDAGYQVGCAGKGWGPGKLGDRKSDPAGRHFRNFAQFLDKRDKSKPFCFWFGSTNPHFPHPDDGGDLVDVDKIKVPGFLPDCPITRRELAGYLYECVLWDREVARNLEALEAAGLTENTLVVITSDNGMPFVRGKCNLYDHGVRMPFAVRWPARVPGRRVVTDMISFSDVGPTFLAAAGVEKPEEMIGRSFLDVLTSSKDGLVDPERDFVVNARERHMVCRPGHVGYPVRAIRTHDYLYLRNFEPDRSPTGRPYGTCDVTPREDTIDQYMVEHQNDPAIRPLFELCFVERPAEELYDMKADPDQLDNLADHRDYQEVKERLRERMMVYLKATDDPRTLGRGEVFDQYPFWLNDYDREILKIQKEQGLVP
jgi:arylsulfatase A-like enzyme